MAQESREEHFFATLRELFVGARVEGKSGYINLMRIKARYFERGVFPRLRDDIDEACRPFDSKFREELFDRLYTFFHRYFSESGSIYYRYTPLHERVYEQVYTDDRDVMLFWKTHMLYYVKTDRLFENMEVEVDGLRFGFDVSTLEYKKANEKRDVVYAFSGKRGDGALVFSVGYSTKGRQTKLDDIRRDVHAAGVRANEETLEHAFRLFERQSEVDYFINKDARGFLREQFDLWLYQYVFKGETEWSETRIRQLQALKEIAYKIIDFIAQFEDELVRIWNKPKFALNSHYVITLERIAGQGEALLERFLGHAGMAEQVREWQELGMVGEDFGPSQVWETDLLGRRLHDRYRYLPLDTRHFADLEAELVGSFEHLDEALDGWLIKSENYQALNTLLPKFRSKVGFVYIDPPYNAEGSEIIYENDYRSSSWLTLVDNRVTFVPELLKPEQSVLAIAVDDYEMSRLVQLLRQKLLGWNVATIVVNHHPQGSPKANVSRTHEYMLVVTPDGADILRVPRPEGRGDERSFMRSGTGENNFRRNRPRSFYAVLVDSRTGKIQGVEPPPSADYALGETEEGYVRCYPIDSSGNERVWRKTYRSALQAVEKGGVFCRMGRSGPVIYEKVEIERIKPTSNWHESRYNAGTHGSSLLKDILGEGDAFSYPKSIFTVQDTVGAATYDDDEAVVLDFFAGSGTTAHAVMNLNREDGGRRKYILVEMADYFDTVILPRVKKVAFSDQWKEGKAQEGQGMSQFVKVFQLEQYEDVLRRAHYADADALFVTDPYSQYVFLRDTKMMDNAQTGEAVVTVDTGKEEIRVELGKLYERIDLAETLSCLTGKWIRRVTPGEVEFEGGERASLAAPPWEMAKRLVWW